LKSVRVVIGIEFEFRPMPPLDLCCISCSLNKPRLWRQRSIKSRIKDSHFSVLNPLTASDWSKTLKIQRMHTEDCGVATSLCRDRSPIMERTFGLSPIADH
jgi:hypothetical protein